MQFGQKPKHAGKEASKEKAKAFVTWATTQGAFLCLARDGFYFVHKNSAKAEIGLCPDELSKS